MSSAPPGELSLASVAVRLSELVQRVDALQSRLATSEDTIKEHASGVAEAAGLAREVTRLAGQLADPDATEGPSGRGVHPRNWATMSDADSADALRDLASWVTEILLALYPHLAEELPPCWPAHTAVVAELDWLYWAWEDVWALGAQPHPRDAADWHDRWLPGVRERIRPRLAACNRSDQHVKPGHPRAQHREYQRPPGTSPQQHHPELDFIENMRRAGRAELARGGMHPLSADIDLVGRSAL